MKRLFMLALALSCVALVSTNATAAIDWAGQAFPNHGHVTTPTGDQFVVAEVFKAGYTDGVGQGLEIAARLVYQTDLMATATAIPMAYNVDKGSNDEYLGFIPQAALVGASYVDVTVFFDDLTDGTNFEITADQAGNVPPLRYDISAVLPNDVDVSFSVCMSGTATLGDVCVIGSAPEIGAWGTGVNLTNVSGELWEGTVTFLAGSSPAFEYKFKKDGCTDWEFVGNRFVTLPTDGTTAITLDVQSFNNAPIGCGIGDALAEDKVICFTVCLEGVVTDGDVCVIGNLAEIGNWTTGVTLNPIGTTQYHACVVIPAGSPAPITMEYKFQKDGCATWEGVANRIVTIDNSTPSELNLSNTWDDGPGTCDPVANDVESFGAVKAHFRN